MRRIADSKNFRLRPFYHGGEFFSPTTKPNKSPCRRSFCFVLFCVLNREVSNPEFSENVDVLEKFILSRFRKGKLKFFLVGRKTKSVVGRDQLSS